MVFSSVIFLVVFLPLTLAGYYLLDRRFKNTFLLIASLFFYAYGEPVFVCLMILSIIVNYLMALAISSFRRAEKQKSAKLILILGIGFNLLFFFVFKYLNFTVYNINSLLEFFGSNILLPQTDIRLPIGISFFTFQAMSYIFDVYSGKGELQKNPLNLALYISLFPQLIAGPIVRYQTVADEIQTRKETLSDFSRGIERFLIGLSKKTLLSNTLAVSVDFSFRNFGTEIMLTGLAWLGAIAYALQIYFDFSGYSDMAIGLGLMFGFHFLENFNYPYMAGSVSDFWRRWHISLGTWFRDYVYFPLGGSRVKSSKKLVFNLFVVWGLTGIWHGANWTFIAWGLWYFVLLSFEKVFHLEERLAIRKKAPDKSFAIRMKAGAYRVFSLLCVLFGWVIFRAESLRDGMQYIKTMLCFFQTDIWNSTAGAMLEQYLVLVVIAILCCFNWKKLLGDFLELINLRMPHALPLLKGILISAISLASVSFIASSSYNPFIYFNF